MQDIVPMHMLYALANLLDVFSHYLLREPAYFLQVLIEILAQAWFKHEIGSLLVDEEVVEMHYVRMVQKALDFYLSD